MACLTLSLSPSLSLRAVRAVLDRSYSQPRLVMYSVQDDRRKGVPAPTPHSAGLCVGNPSPSLLAPRQKMKIKRQSSSSSPAPRPSHTIIQSNPPSQTAPPPTPSSSLLPAPSPPPAPPTAARVAPPAAAPTVVGPVPVPPDPEQARHQLLLQPLQDATAQRHPPAEIGARGRRQGPLALLLLAAAGGGGPAGGRNALGRHVLTGKEGEEVVARLLALGVVSGRQILSRVGWVRSQRHPPKKGRKKADDGLCCTGPKQTQTPPPPPPPSPPPPKRAGDGPCCRSRARSRGSCSRR